MNSFFQTEAFSCALIEALDCAAHGGADMGECLSAAQMVREGDHESWHIAWIGLAERVRRWAASDLAEGRKGAARDAFLRAAHYYRTAGRFLQRDGRDPRVSTTREASGACFKTAMRLSAPACEAVEIAHEGTRRTGYLHRAGGDERPRATLLAVGVAGATPLELYFACALAALRRGWHCLAVNGGEEAEPDRRGLAEAFLGAAAALPLVDPACLAALAYGEQPASHPGGDRRHARPLAVGNVEEVASALRGAARNPILVADAEAGGSPCAGALGRFHRSLSCWLDGQFTLGARP